MEKHFKDLKLGTVFNFITTACEATKVIPRPGQNYSGGCSLCGCPAHLWINAESPGINWHVCPNEKVLMVDVYG